MMFIIINALLYTIGWWLSVYWGASSYYTSAWLPSFVIVLGQLIYLYRVDPKAFYQDLFLVLYALMIGYVMEFVFTRLGLITYSDQPQTVTLWILMLYPAFVLTFNHSMKWLNDKRVYPILLGMFSPLVYLCGYKMGACLFPMGFWTMSLVVIPCWCLFLHLMCNLNRRLKNIVYQAFKSEDKGVTMLYDGECPLCSKEVGWMLKGCPTQVKFVNIADPMYDAEKYNNLDYKTAMQAMHAIDSEGHTLVGVEAFAEIYAALHWRLLSLLLRVPVFKQMASIGYYFFAKYRLRLTGRNL